MKRPKHGMQGKVEEFWTWFAKNEKRIFAFEQDHESIFRELHEKMLEVNSDLCFEFSNAVEGKREFVISAGGIRDSFPAVIELKDKAPPFEHFHITAFRQREPVLLSVEIGDFKIAPENVFVSTEEDGDRTGVLVLMSNVDGASAELRRALDQAVFLMLDSALGEYDVATRLSWIELADIDSHRHLPAVGIDKLSEIVDRNPSGRQTLPSRR